MSSLRAENGAGAARRRLTWEDGWFFQEKQGLCGGFTNENGGLNNNL